MFCKRKIAFDVRKNRTVLISNLYILYAHLFLDRLFNWESINFLL